MDCLSGLGMCEGQSICMQEQALGPGCAGSAAVKRVAENRVADCLQMHPQLVGAAGERPQQQVRSVCRAIMAEHLIAGQRRLAAETAHLLQGAALDRRGRGGRMR